MNTPKMITIQGAKRSADGKWLLLTDQDNITYLSNKCWDLEMMVGATVMAQTNMLSGQDGPTWFLNSYQMTDGQPTPPASIPAPPPIQTPVQMPQQPPVQHPQAPVPAQPRQVDRDASIVALTLCKTVTFSNIGLAWTAYTELYALTHFKAALAGLYLFPFDVPRPAQIAAGLLFVHGRIKSIDLAA